MKKLIRKSISKNKLLNVIYSDLMRYYKHSPNSSLAGMALTFCFSYGFQSVFVFRFGKHAYTKNKETNGVFSKLNLFIYFILSRITNAFYGIRININAEIGEGLYIGHFGGVSVGNCSIGSNCSINQHVCIGNPVDFNELTQTRIGNNVWIGAHAKIKNNVIIEDNATIAAGAVVKEGMRIKSNDLIMGLDARVISRNFDNSFLL